MNLDIGFLSMQTGLLSYENVLFVTKSLTKCKGEKN